MTKSTPREEGPTSRPEGSRRRSASPHRIIHQTTPRACRSELGSALLIAALTIATVASASAPLGASLRDELGSIPPSPELQDEIDLYRALDPTAEFTFLRGHIDAFSAHPKGDVPGYAKLILNEAGLPTEPVIQPLLPTTHEEKVAEGDAALPREAEWAGDLGNGGEDDADALGDSEPGDADEHGGEDTWYDQSGEEVVEAILHEFLWRNRSLFELDAEYLTEGLPSLELQRYGVGKYFRRAEFTQKIGAKRVLDSKTLVLFDLNWNVVVISRQLMTGAKLGVEPTPIIRFPRARRLAFEALGLAADEGRLLGGGRGIDARRGIFAWQLEVADTRDGSEYTVTLAGADGQVLNISDDTARYTDAKVKRWNYPDGDFTTPRRVTTSNIYTRDDNTLVHDFFYLVNDDRNDGGTGACGSTSPASNSTPNAYGRRNSSEYMRPTRRGDRDFSLWNPHEQTGTFGEGHVYYWARKYMQWQKQALIDLGLLTSGQVDRYTKALIIVNACDEDSGQYKREGTYDVSTMSNLGEGLGTILLPERCRSGNPNCAAPDYEDSKSGFTYTYEGSGGYHSPGVIHHELNHFVLHEYLGVHNTLDCSIGQELQYFQEGGLGRTLPQMYWHSKYDVGYLPDSDDQLFRSGPGKSGEAHDETDHDTLNYQASFICATGTDEPYLWGSTLSQPSWEIFHGQRIDGSNRFGMGRPADDTGMITSLYYAADLAAASTWQDRWEVANRFMQLWELTGGASPLTKHYWCDAWDHHGLRTYMPLSYCS